MLENTRKIHLIEEVLKVEDKSILEELENVLKKSRVKSSSKQIAKKNFISELKESIKEVSLAKKGKVKLQSAKSFLNEI